MRPEDLQKTRQAFVLTETPHADALRRLDRTLAAHVVLTRQKELTSCYPGDHFLFWNDYPKEIAVDAKLISPIQQDLQKDGYGGRHAPPDYLWKHRLWTEGALTFKQPIILDRVANCFELIGAIDCADICNCRVTIWRYIIQDVVLKLIEKRVLLYSNADYRARKQQPSKSRTDSLLAEWIPSDVLLFRYSALTSNAHRIHFDREYAQDIERYPDILAQGSLSVTCALRSLPRNTSPIVSCNYQMISPVFARETIEVRHREGPTSSRLMILSRHTQELKLVIKLRHNSELQS